MESQSTFFAYFVFNKNEIIKHFEAIFKFSSNVDCTKIKAILANIKTTQNDTGDKKPL